ncbi:MAG: fused MFS/spermidine synthase [Mariprofundales bacterium]
MNTSQLRLVVVLLYGASGITALAYEVLWMRPIGLLFGIGNFGVVITVAAFMAGLGVGSLMGSRLYRSARWALMLFAAIEGGVALFALLLPTLLPMLDQQLITMGGSVSIGVWQMWEAVAAFVLLLLPASAMGLAFPLILTAARHFNLSVATLYGANALGGVVGALLPLLLLPLVGWSSALHWVLLLGMLLGLCAFMVAKGLPAAAHASKPQWPSSHPQLLDMVAYAGVGAAALMIEIGWVRMFGMVLLRTEYLLALILALMLLGIGGGSLLARRWYAPQLLLLLPWLAALGVLGSLVAWPWLGQWAGAAQFDSLGAAIVLQGALVALLTLPTTLVLGAWLPLLAQRLKMDGATHGTAAWLYGANSVGAAVGAVVAGMVLMPWLGTPATLLLAALLLLLCALRWGGAWRLQGGVLLAFALLASLWWQMPAANLLTAAVADTVELDRFEDAVNVTHVVQRPDGERLLLADLQRMDAATDPTSVAVQKNQARLPLLLYPDAKRVLFLGLGTGITAAGSLPWKGVDRTAVELSPGAIAAATRWFAPVNGDISNHAHIVHDDVRRFLRRGSSVGYDIIIGDLFHPDMAGRGALLSVEQFTRVRQRLAPKGLFVQWIAINQFDIANLAVVFATFHHVFPDGVIFIDGYRLALVARPGASLQLSAKIPFGGDGGEGAMTWRARLWGGVPAVDAQLQSEWWPVIEYTLPKVRYRDTSVMVRSWQWLLQFRAADRAAADALHLRQDQRLQFGQARRANLLNVRSWIAELQGDGRAANQLVGDAYRYNPDNRWASFAIADRLMRSIDANHLPAGVTRLQALQQLLLIRPDHEQALRMMIAFTANNAVLQRKWRQRLHQIAPLAQLP